MNHCLLLLACLLICGCAGRTNTDLLQARIREQALELTEKQREISQAKSDLQRANQETEQLRSELIQAGHSTESAAPSTNVKVARVHIYPLASGGLNKDNDPGDDAVVVQFAPFNSDNEPIKFPGQVQIVLLDPRLPDGENEVGRWHYTTQECRDHWTRGLTSSGYQFTLPFDRAPEHADLVVKLQFRTSKDQMFEATQMVKVAVSTALSKPQNRKKPVQVVQETEESLPPVDESSADSMESDWESDDREERPTKSGKSVLHSSNWTDSTIPVLR